MLKLNGVEVKPTIFPDKTSQIWKLVEQFDYIKREHVIEWRFEHEGELFHLKQLRDLIFSYSGKYKVFLWMPYLPYSRQDKIFHNNECFALRSFATIINSMGFEMVSAFDPHSSLPERIINNFRPVRPDVIIHTLSRDYDTVCYPDLGAQHRYHVVDKQSLIGDKVRDKSTGRITSYSLNRQPEKNEKILVIDDLCDGGFTYLLLAKELQYCDIRPSLYVSHGLFSKGIDELKLYYSKIITTDTLAQQEDDRLTVIPVTTPF